MSALVELDSGAFVHVTVGWLVTVVCAIRHFVAHQRGVNALPAGAPELFSAARSRRSVPATCRTSELVRVIAAIVLAIAPIRVPDALEVLTSELPRRTRLVLRVTVLALVRTVATVVVVVTHPATVDAPPVAARELISSAVGYRRAVEQRCILVRSINAVRVAVAQPLFRYTLCPVPRLVRQTREFGRFVAFTVVYGEKVILISQYEETELFLNF